MKQFISELKLVFGAISNWKSLPDVEKKTFATLAALTVVFVMIVVFQKISS